MAAASGFWREPKPSQGITPVANESMAPGRESANADSLVVTCAPNLTLVEGSRNIVLAVCAVSGGTAPYAWQWSTVSEADRALISREATSTPLFHVPSNVPKDRAVALMVTVSDRAGTEVGERIAVTVRDRPDVAYGPRVVRIEREAGDGAIRLGGEWSAAGGPGPYSYHWTARGATQATALERLRPSASVRSPEFVIPGVIEAEELYEFRLVVSAVDEDSAVQDVLVSVRPPGGRSIGVSCADMLVQVAAAAPAELDCESEFSGTVTWHWEPLEDAPVLQVGASPSTPLFVAPETVPEGLAAYRYRVRTMAQEGTASAVVTVLVSADPLSPEAVCTDAGGTLSAGCQIARRSRDASGLDAPWDRQEAQRAPARYTTILESVANADKAQDQCPDDRNVPEGQVCTTTERCRLTAASSEIFFAGNSSIIEWDVTPVPGWPSAIPDVDISLPDPVLVHRPGGEEYSNYVEFEFTGLEDSDPEGHETFVGYCSAVSEEYPDGLRSGPSIRYVFEDDDWWVNNARELEGAGAMVFEVGFDSPVVRELTIDYETVQVNNGGAKAGLDYIETASSITFAAGDQSKTITVTLVDDTESEETEFFQLNTTSSSYFEDKAVIAVGTIEDDDFYAVVATPDAITVVEGDADGKSFEVQLASEPTANVTVKITGHAGTDVTPSPTSLTFKTDNWDDDQSVTVTAAQDDDAKDEEEMLRLTANGGDYVDVTATVTVTVDDDDTPDLAVEPTELEIAEGDAIGKSFEVHLASEPTANVTVKITGHAGTDVTPSPTSLTFKTDNWDDDQSVTVTAAQDDDAKDEEEMLRLTANGGDYVDVTATVTVTVADDDTPDLAVEPTELEIAEGDAIGKSFEVHLASEPTANVTVKITGHAGTDVTPSPTSLTFKTDNWDDDQSVTVTAVQDDDAKDEEEMLRLTANGGDYVDVTATVTVTVDDDDTPDLAVEPTELEIAEGDAIGKSFEVHLASEPTANVTVKITGHAGTDVTPSPTSLTFTTDNWDDDQSVTVTAVRDDDAKDEEEMLRLTANGGDYVDVTATVTVTVDDDDTPDLAVEPTELEIAEGDAIGKSFEVHLASEPTANVTVKITGHAGTDVTPSPTSLTFTTDNWDDDQSVTVTAVQDDDAKDEEEMLRLTANGGDYVDVTATVTVMVDDDDTPDLAVEPTELEIAEGDAVGMNFGVHLASEPAANVMVAITGHVGTDVTPSPTSLTFTTDNWDDDQTVTVKAAEDDDAVDDNATLTLTANGGDYVDITTTVAVKVIDNGVGATLQLADARVSESAGAAVFQVRLSEPQASDVTVHYATSDGTAEAGSDYIESRGTLTLAAGAVSKEIRVPITDDAEDEDNETFTVRLSAPAGASLYDAEATGTILDNEPGVSIDADVRVGEAEGNAGFTVTMTSASPWDVAVDYATEDGTARAGSDYSETRGTVTFAPGMTQQPIAVAIADDSFDEADETFRIVLSDASAAGLEQAVGTATIIDDDDAPTLEVNGASVSEHVGEAVVFVRLTSAREAEVRVHIATEDGTAVAGADYTASTSELVFAPGDTQESVRIAILEDDLIEGDEAFQVLLSGAQNANIAAEAATVTILDNDTRSDLAIADATVLEDAGTSEVRVQLSPARSTAVTVDWATADGTATAGTDYEADSGVVTFAPGATEQTINVTVLNDAVDEASETFVVRLSNASGSAEIVRSTSGVTILDDDGAAALTISDLTTQESAGAVRVRVALSPASDEAVTVQYATSDGTATVGEDYTLESGTLTIPAKDTEARIEVTILNDLTVEAAETFTVTLTSPAGAEISRGAATVTINDDDLPVLSIDDVVANEDDAQAKFTVSLDVPSVRPVRVQYASLDGSATTGQDFHPASGALVIPPGQMSGQVEVNVIEDALVEGDETFTLNLSNPTGAELGEATGEGTIRDNDVYRLSVDNVVVGEADGEARFTVSLDRANPAQTVRVNYATIDGAATAAADYEERTGTLEIAPGVQGGTIGVPILDDAEREGTEAFALVLSGAQNAEIAGAQGTGTIVDNDLLNLRIANARANEDAGQMLFVVSLDASSSLAVSTAYETQQASATQGVDYVRAAGRLRFEPGETEKTIAVDLLDDDLDEPNETFTVSLSKAENAEYALPEATGTIVDDDGQPVLSVVSSVRVGEGDGSAAFAVTLSNPGSFEVTAMYATTDGTATAGADYETATGTLHIAPGETAGTITVPIFEDDVREGDETFSLALSGAQNASLRLATGTGTILDNDAEPSLNIDDVAVAEDAGSAVFSVTLSGPSAAAVSVAYATEDETATMGADYEGATGTLRIAPGETAGTITVPILSDDLAEEDETFLVKLSGAENAEITDGTGRGTITDNDEPVTISIHDAQAMEDARILHLPVRLSRASSRVVSVRFESSDIAAEAGLDYTASRGIVAFERGSTKGVLSISVLNDELDEEAEETFRVTLSQPTNAAIARAAATGTIVDNDGVPLLRIDDITASEDGGEAIFTVSLSVPSARLVTAAYRTFDGTAQAGTDYVMASGTLAIAPGDMEAEVHVRLLQDGRDWREETFSLALESASNAMLEDAVATATIVEEESVEEGVLKAHLARFARTAAGHVVEAMAERLQWLDIDPACAPVAGESLQALRYANPNWNPSAGELLSGCGLTARTGAYGVWGRGAFTRLSGKEGALSLSADVTTAAVGADYRWKSGLMAGLMLSHSQAAGTFAAYAAEGETGSMLTGAYPYVSYRLQSTNIWALAGLGRGSVEVEGAEHVQADLGSRLVAAGATGTLASSARGRLSYKADAFFCARRGKGKGKRQRQPPAGRAGRQRRTEQINTSVSGGRSSSGRRGRGNGAGAGARNGRRSAPGASGKQIAGGSEFARSNEACEWRACGMGRGGGAALRRAARTRAYRRDTSGMGSRTDRRHAGALAPRFGRGRGDQPARPEAH